MEQSNAIIGRFPIFSLIAGAVLALSLFTPFFLLTLPVMVAVALCIVGAIRKERPVFVPYVVGGLAMLLIFASQSSRPFGSSAQVILPSQIYRDAKWEYGTTKDEMRGTVDRNATLYSPTDLDLPFPYNGTNAASLFVSQSSGLMLTVEKGQFQCSTDTRVSVKFDDGPVYSYPCSMPDNGKAEYLFINEEYSPQTGQPVDPKDGLAKAHRMIIEVEFFDAGTRQITFNVSGFDPAKLR